MRRAQDAGKRSAQKAEMMSGVDEVHLIELAS
jgi:hypothetical protein